jgi:CBS domain-containing protein
MLATAKATSVFVTDASGSAIGVVTDRDFAQKVVAQALPLDRKVTEVMTRPVVTVEASERLFRALLAMVSRNIHHVLVTQQGTPTGVLTAHDLMVLQGKSPLNLVRFIEAQTNVQDLAKANQRISGLLPLLLREGAKASHVTRVVAEVNDRLIVKILQFAGAKLGPPPVPYCWVVLGSEGRREQTFKTDQDNALIYADSQD